MGKTHGFIFHHHSHHRLSVETSVCSGSTQRGQVLSGRCLLKTSLESSWHHHVTTALSTRTRLSLFPWSFSRGLLLPHLFCLFLSLLLSSFPHQTSSCLALSCLVLPTLSMPVTSLLLFVRFVLSFLSHSLAFSLFSVWSRGRYCGDCVVVHCLQF